VTAALEDSSVKGGSSHNKGGGRFAIPLFLSPLTSHLLTFHFSLLRALEKASQNKKSEEERYSI
jgi:hypothetical protein